MKITETWIILLSLSFNYSLANSQTAGKNFKFDKLQLYTNAGVFFLNDVSDMNSFLEANNYPGVSKTQGNLELIKIEVQKKKFITQASVFKTFDQFNTYKSEDVISIYDNWGYSVVFGYEFYSAKTISLVTSLGLDRGTARLKLISSNSNEIIQDFVATPNITNMFHSYYGLRGEVCLKTIPVNNIGFMLSLGYRQSIADGKWYYRDIEFDASPKLNLNGVYFSLGMILNYQIIQSIVQGDPL